MSTHNLPSRRVRSVLLTLLAACELGACQHAPKAADAPAPASTTAAPVTSARYLSYTSATKFADSKYKNLLPTPPATRVNSEKDFESQIVWSVRDHASPFAKANALSEENAMPIGSFSQAMGVDLNSPECKPIRTFIGVAVADADLVKKSAKEHFQRLRPMLDIASPAKRNDFSYPSGHATTASIRARLLAAVTSAEPAREKQLLEVATLSCMNRVIQNMHFPTDIAAGFALGQTLGDEILEIAKNDPNSQAAKDLEAAQDAWNSLPKK